MNSQKAVAHLIMLAENKEKWAKDGFFPMEDGTKAPMAEASIYRLKNEAIIYRDFAKAISLIEPGVDWAYSR